MVIAKWGYTIYPEPVSDWEWESWIDSEDTAVVRALEILCPRRANMLGFSHVRVMRNTLTQEYPVCVVVRDGDGSCRVVRAETEAA